MTKVYDILDRTIRRTKSYQPGDSITIAGYYHTLMGSDGKGWNLTVTVPKDIPASLTLSVSGSVNNIISVSGGISTDVTINGVTRLTDNSISINGECANSVGAQKVANLATSGITITFS